MRIEEIDLSLTDISEFNTRKDLSISEQDTGINELASSIKERGLINPITVSRKDNGRYEVIAGQRRVLACRTIGLATIPAIIKEGIINNEKLIISLTENIHRIDMSALDKAKAYKIISDKYEGDWEQITARTNVSTGTIRKYLALLNLTEEIQDNLSEHEKDFGIGALSTLSQKFKQEEHIKVLDKIIGFDQQTQIKILKLSEGNYERLLELRDQALKGVFDIKSCQDGLCPLIPDEMRIILLQKRAQIKNTGLDKIA